MARTVNEAAHEARRNAILDAAESAIATKGYEQMAIADLLGELHMSSGALYHYFDSKSTLLSALVERMGSRAEQLVLPIVHDPTLSALDKLQRLVATPDHWKLAHKRFVLAYLRIWYADENAIVRQKLIIERYKRFTPWLERIILQGRDEGVFTARYPDQTARVIVSLLEDLGQAVAELLLTQNRSHDLLPSLERIVEAHADTLEQVLGVTSGSLQHAFRERLAEWATAMEKEDEL